MTNIEKLQLLIEGQREDIRYLIDERNRLSKELDETQRFHALLANKVVSISLKSLIKDIFK